MLRSFRCFWLSISWLSTVSASAQVTSANLLNHQTDQFVRQLMDRAHVPGLSITIIRDGQLYYSQGYGLTKSDSTQRVTSETIFEAASLSKPVFAYAVLQLVEQGVLDLDKPLFEYLPYPDAADDERYKKITARLVLSHRTGFPNWRKNRKLPKLSMVAPPGERFGYSGEGYVYLQKVVEKISGKPLNTIMTEQVFTPLKMTRSSYIWNPAFDANFGLPHDQEGQAETKYKSNMANAAYSLQTTADDYARFVLAIMTSRGLKPGTIDQMLSFQVRLPKSFSGGESLSPTLHWGLGFGLERTPESDYFWHWGDNDTYKCYIVGSRQRRDGVVYFTNSANGLRLVSELNRHFMGFDTSTVDFLGYKSN
ncbi:serine hydrolase domain-containing protein [Spirosoma sp.]|uniref:serine hydrolase domain-containing protein n=1 Tax=Spirosoma sp. TaxID=1899569 RepID=UPI00260E294F|nr:serine hydrolase domain-containing protein [Spirosoma sp.]MCX6215212.1 serine hydrolase [Spirosoma sp.]